MPRSSLPEASLPVSPPAAVSAALSPADGTAGAHADELQVARRAVRAAGDMLLGHFRAGIAPEYKGRKDLVTVADRSSEQLIRRMIAEAFPDDVVVGEEGEQQPEQSVTGRRRWYVDPLDGTTNFVKGQPRWAVSIAFCDTDDAFGACAILRPFQHEEYTAVRAGGAWRDGRRLLRQDDPEVVDALVLLGPMADRGDAIGPIARQSLSIRVTGSTVSDLTDVAGGRADLHIGCRQGRWDLAAGTLLAVESGLVVTDMTGVTLRGPGDNVVAGPAKVHAAALEVLQRT